MPKTFQLSILTPEHVFFAGQAQMLRVEAVDGQACILPEHAPTVISVAEGEIALRDSDGNERWAASSDGFLTVTQDEVVLMLQSAEWPEDIDRVRAEKAQRRANEALSQKLDRQNYTINQAMLLRAMTRLRVSGRRNVNH